MTKRVIYYSQHPIHYSPPCVTQACTLKDLGYDVIVLTQAYSPETRAIFEAKGITCETIDYLSFPIAAIQKGLNFFHYRKFFQNFFRRYWTDQCIFWCGNEGSARKMRPYLRSVHPYVQNCLEFYEREDYQRDMSQICRSADVVTACESHRAQYMMDWWQLKKLPYVLPNKPYVHPRGRYVTGSTPQVQRAIDQIAGKKSVMYQGVITPSRDLSYLAQALRDGNSDYYLVLSGSNNMGLAEKLAQIYPRTIYLGNIPTPLHLEVTSHATIGIAYYVDDCINNRFCAPNKIYEYAGCGVPMLCNNIPGLEGTVGAAGAAECVDFRDPQAILAAIERINESYDRYSQAATRFFEDTNNGGTIRQIAEEAFSHTKAAQQ